MMRTPSPAHERGISIRTSAPIVVRMNSLASPTVHENAPSTAWLSDPKMSPMMFAPTSGAGALAAANAGAAPARHRPTASAAAIAIRRPGRIVAARSGQHGRDHDQDQHDPPDHPEQMLGGAHRPG